MLAYWKEVVNFGGDFRGIRLSLIVLGGVGKGEFSSGGIAINGKIMLFLSEGVFPFEFKNGSCDFEFETNKREYYIEIYDGDILVCGGGNAENLRVESAVAKIYASDTFETRVADFNYYETELGEVGKNSESILESMKNQAIETDSNIENLSENTDEKEARNVINSNENKGDKSNHNTATNASRSGGNRKTAGASGQKKAKKKDDFFQLAKPQVERMLAKFPKEEFLEDVIENSKWVKVEFSKGVHYAVGLIFADDLVGYIGYGVKGEFGNPPKFENPQFVPLDITKPNGEGYFLIFQRADTGEKV